MAGPSFVVQVKSRKDPIVYRTDLAIDWIANQENPLFICYVDVPALHVQLYSTWILLEGLLRFGPSVTVLEPDVDALPENVRKDDEEVLHVPLGSPVLSLEVRDVVDPDRSAKWNQVLDEWIRVDRQNIVNRGGKIHWIHGPDGYETNELLSKDPRFRTSFYWNAKNLESSLRNFTKAITLLRLEVSQVMTKSEHRVGAEKLAALDSLLSAFWAELGPSARLAIREHVDGGWPPEPTSDRDLLAELLD